MNSQVRQATTQKAYVACASKAAALRHITSQEPDSHVQECTLIPAESRSPQQLRQRSSHDYIFGSIYYVIANTETERNVLGITGLNRNPCLLLLLLDMFIGRELLQNIF